MSQRTSRRRFKKSNSDACKLIYEELERESPGVPPSILEQEQEEYDELEAIDNAPPPLPPKQKFGQEFERWRERHFKEESLLLREELNKYKELCGIYLERLDAANRENFYLREYIEKQENIPRNQNKLLKKNNLEENDKDCHQYEHIQMKDQDILEHPYDEISLEHELKQDGLYKMETEANDRMLTTPLTQDEYLPGERPELDSPTLSMLPLPTLSNHYSHSHNAEINLKVEQHVETVKNREQLREHQGFEFESDREIKHRTGALKRENKQPREKIKLAKESSVANMSGLSQKLIDAKNQEREHLSEKIVQLFADISDHKAETGVKTLDDKDTCTFQLEDLYATLGIDVTLECGIDLFPAFFNSCKAIQDIIKVGKRVPDLQVFDQLDYSLMNVKGVTIYTSSSLLKDITEAQPEIPNVAEYCLNKHTIGHPFVVIVKRDMESTLKKWIEDPQKNVNMMCVLLLDTLADDTYIPPIGNIFMEYATVSNIFTSTDDILERAVFSVLNGFVERCMPLYAILDKRTDTEKETLQYIYASARNAYARSEVPKCERPNIPETIYQYPDNIDSVIADLLQIPGVIGCSKSGGKIEVCIESKVYPDVQVKVKKVTRANNINVKCVSCTFTKYFSAGDKIDVNLSGKFGTLGGFAYRYPKPPECQMKNKHSADEVLESNQRRLAAVTAKHMTVACGRERMDLIVGGQIIGHTDLKDLRHDFDVLPIDVYQKYETKCDTRYKTEKGKYIYGVLLSDELRQSLPTMPVFLWGAMSSPGLGRIEQIMDMADGIYIRITDRNEGCSFSKPGDSGAIICGTDLRERILYVIAVLSGESLGLSPIRYNAVLWKESFEKLGKIYGSDFKLGIDES